MEFVDAKLGASIKHWVRLTQTTSGVVSRFPIEDYNFAIKVLEKGVYSDIDGSTVAIATDSEIALLPSTDKTKVGVLSVLLPGSTDTGAFAMRSTATEVRLIATAKLDAKVLEVLPSMTVTRS